jgi:hypothetical protein
MRAVLCVLLTGVALGVAVWPAAADGTADRTAELDAAARTFLKAYHAKDIDGLIAVADAPFFVGTFKAPKILWTRADVRAELKSRLAAGGKLPSQVEKTLTWDKAITNMLSAEEERRTREQIKPATDVTGRDGGYAALSDPAGGAKGKRWSAVSDTRLLVGIRNGTAKVVGILMDR